MHALTASVSCHGGCIKVVVNLSLWNVDNNTTSVLTSVISCNVTENKLSSLRIHMWIIRLHSRHYRTTRGNPYDGGWRKQIWKLTSSAVKGHDLSTSIQFTMRCNGNSRFGGKNYKIEELCMTQMYIILCIAHLLTFNCQIVTF